MNEINTRIGVAGAGFVLALGMITAGASPAGATRGGSQVESTESVRTGGSQSDPDGNSNGGKDKPGYNGGYDSDKDWNNGCGNDADREDDNNGWCGRKPSKDKSGNEAEAAARNDEAATVSATVSTPAPAPATFTAAGTTARAQPAGTEVAGAQVGADSTTPPLVATTPAGSTETEVLGETLVRPSALARTGAGVGALALLGAGMLGAGRLAAFARRRLGAN